MLGKGGQVVDVFMDVNNAAPHLHHTVVSLLCILLVKKNEKEEASCLVGIFDEVGVQNLDGEVGEAQGHVILDENTILPVLNLSLVMNGVILSLLTFYFSLGVDIT